MTYQITMTVIIIGSLLVLFYSTIGYLLLIRLWAAVRPLPTQWAPWQGTVTVLIVVRNGEEWIAAKVRNLLNQEQAGDLEIVVISDGSTDGTCQRAREIEDPRVHVIELKSPRGKAAVLSEYIPKANGDVVVLSDVRQLFDPLALYYLAGNFSDATVGVVSGKFIFESPQQRTPIAEGISTYWRYEELLREYEARVDSSIGGKGAIYAVRRSAFEPIPADTTLDDVVIPMQIVAKGFRAVIDTRAVTHDTVSQEEDREYQRKVRTLAGNFQMLCRYPRWLLPWHSRVWLQYISHKVCRLLCPFCLLAILICSIMPGHSSPWLRWLLLAQVGLYLLAIIGRYHRQTQNGVGRLIAFTYSFTWLNMCVLVGLKQFLCGGCTGVWEPTPPKPARTD